MMHSIQVPCKQEFFTMILRIYFLMFLASIAAQSLDTTRIELNPSVFEFKLREFADFSLKHAEVQVGYQ